MIWASLLAAASAFLINLLILPLVLRLAHRHKWYDRPDSRKIHTGLIPRMGGPGLFPLLRPGRRARRCWLCRAWAAGACWSRA